MTRIVGTSSSSLSLVAGLFILLSLCSCSISTQPTNNLEQRLELDLSDTGSNYPARVSLFISLAENGVIGTVCQFNAIDIFREGDQWISLLNSPVVMDSGLLINEQLLLARKPLPLGKYIKMRITFLKKNAVKESIAEILLGRPLPIAKGASRSLFLKWNVGRYLDASIHNESAFTAFPQLNQLTSDLVYVSCPEIDTIYMVRSESNKISGSFAVEGEPTYIVGSEDERDIYVLTSKPPSVKIYNKISGSIRQSINLQMIQAPGYLSINGQDSVIYVTDDLTNYLYRVDLTNGIVTAKRHLQEVISYITYKDNLLVVSLATQELVLLDPQSLQEKSRIAVGTTVAGILVEDNKIYTAQNKNNSIDSYDLTTGKSAKLYVGFEPMRLIKANQYIYVSNSRSSSLSMFSPETFNVLREIRIGGQPVDMAYSAKYKWLYVTDHSAKVLSVIDTGTNKITRKIYLGTPPLGLLAPN